MDLVTAFSTEWSIERQVLHNQCKRLEAQNYNLSRTAEQLSVTMAVSEISHLLRPLVRQHGRREGGQI